MNSVIYYSNTGQSKRIAEYFAEQTGYALLDLTKLNQTDFENTILVFPVHCQNIPDIVKTALSRINTKTLSIIATYGKMSHGNVLYEIQKRYYSNVIAAAYVPTIHSYKPNPDDEFTDFESLNPIIVKLDNPSTVKIPKSFKNPLSNIFPNLRSRMGVKIHKDSNCNSCGICNNICDSNAIISGKTNRNCIRCLKCVKQCPQQALHFSLGLSMHTYLNKKKLNKLTVYV